MSRHSLTDLEVNFAIICENLLIIIKKFLYNFSDKIAFQHCAHSMKCDLDESTFRQNSFLDKVSFDEVLYTHWTVRIESNLFQD